MTEQPPAAGESQPGEQRSPTGDYPPPPPGDYPPPPAGNYPPPPPGNFPPPPPGQGYAPYARNGYVDIPGAGPVRVAGIGQRLLARLIDSVVYFVVYWFFLFIGIASVAASSGPTVSDVYGNDTPEPSGAGLLGFLLAMLLASASGLLYEWLMVGLLGATLGKLALGIKVVNQSTGAVIGLGGAFVRQIIPFLGGLFCYVGALLVYVSPLFDNSGRVQGWHDRAANDLVSRTR